MQTKRPRQSQGSGKKDISLMIFLVLMGMAGIFLFIGLQPTPVKESRSRRESIISAYSEKADALVNKHLFWTNRKIEIARQKSMTDNFFSAPQVGDSVIRNHLDQKRKDMGVDYSPDRNEHNAYDDLQRDRKNFRATDPDHLIQQQLADQEIQAEYDREYQKEYARQFIENARQNGYDVQLNDEYVVTGVRPLRNSNRNSTLSAPSGVQAQ
ncbi:MAG: hypothetical protein COT73_07900 [Bdellovibrio sp. CG10_big_fil_rev_8_21_14_0_10_47_8]|nr:MAG: hypothetical protein COT73_07900 [Bdellovibrio sp. CG10_big_fil_rev_8_21_14_0_10_47_8]